MPVHKDESPALYEFTPPGKAARPVSEDITLLSIANLVLRHRRLIALSIAIVLAVIVIRETLHRRQYVSTASFISQNARPQSGLFGLADQVGIQLGGANTDESPQFYMDLIRSREILRAVSQKPYAVQDGGRQVRGTYADLAGIEESDSALRDAAALKSLNE